MVALRRGCGCWTRRADDHSAISHAAGTGSNASAVWRFATVLTVVLASAASAAEPALRVGFIGTTSGKRGAESAAALALAGELASVTVIAPRPDGTFVDPAGNPVALERFGILWLHEGDAPELSGPLQSDETLAALREYVARGRGLFLSGAALALVKPLGVEPVTPRTGAGGKDNYAAALTPVNAKHPVFRGLSLQGRSAYVSNAGHPAFADFYNAGGPRGGMLLAKAPAGTENPLVEYELGKGRIVAMGWRLPHYANGSNPHRINLRRLTANILGYLAEPKDWQPVVIQPAEGVVKTDLGVSADEWRALEMAIADLGRTFPDKYPHDSYRKRLRELKGRHDPLRDKGKPIDSAARQALDRIRSEFVALKRDSLLANPLLDFDKLLLVKRGDGNLGLPLNWQGNSCLPRAGYDNEIMTLSPVRPDGKLTAFYRPSEGKFVGDLEIHFDADRLMFSMPGKSGAWQVHEIGIDGRNLRALPLIPDPDVNNYDACYLPDGDVIFCSTAPFVGVPCVTGSSHVANLFRYERATGKIRQLTFEQDHDWCPTVLNNGRVLYLRWEYSDLPHFVSRILFHMNPDGTEQTEYYGSSSYWPNALFYARPVPNHPTKFVGIVGGHHDVPRMGEMVLFDPAKGRFEADGAIQRIPGWGKKVEPVLLDGLVGGSWPKFLHPWPLSDKYFLVSARPHPQAQWGIYLVDVFDNMVLLKEEAGYALLEPIPIRPRPKPPVVPSRVKPDSKEAAVYIADIHSGPGLAGIPRGTVKSLRLFTYHFAYHGVGGQVHRVGFDGPWDIKRILGTVPVESDGSVYFRVPANTPISVQPLDAEGKALQLMRSWMTAMPGETLTCVGCHDRRNESPPNFQTLALARPPAPIKPWYGPDRGFAFHREVQPVLDRYCVACHDGQPGETKSSIDLAARPWAHPQGTSPSYNNQTKFSPSYLALRRFVRAATIESDMHLLTPMEFHADTTKLVQMLRKGHHNVQLDAEAWDRLITWIDLNTPFHGTWHEIVGMPHIAKVRERRREMLSRYANRQEDPESQTSPPAPVTPIKPAPFVRVAAQRPTCSDWPLPPAQAARRQQALGEVSWTVDLGNKVKLPMVRLPAGRFVMGDSAGHPDETPLTVVEIARPFSMSRIEIANEMYRLFDAAHDSRLEVGDFLHFSEEERGYPVNGADQPVSRVSWSRALAFCDWLSRRTGKRFTLPTEAQWEYACRAGSDAPMGYGAASADFSRRANLADTSLHRVDLFGWGLPVGAIPPWRPAETRYNDNSRVSAPVGSYEPNVWGLFDMHGNVAEWTRSLERSYPYSDSDGRNDLAAAGRRIVRGGSWDDPPSRARAAYRRAHWPYHPPYDVGFRVVCEE